MMRWSARRNGIWPTAERRGLTLLLTWGVRYLPSRSCPRRPKLVCPEERVVDPHAVRDVGILLLLALLFVGVLGALRATRPRHKT